MSRYSSSLSDADEAIVIVEYARRRVTWILTRDEDGSLGVDFRFRRRTDGNGGQPRDRPQNRRRRNRLFTTLLKMDPNRNWKPTSMR